MAETRYYPSSSGYGYDAFNDDHSYYGMYGWYRGSLVQGGYFEPEYVFWRTHYYGICYFKAGSSDNTDAFAAIRAKNVTHYPTNIKLRMRSNVSYVHTMYLHMGKGMAKDSFSGSVRPVNADNGEGITLGAITQACPANGWIEFNINDPDWLKALVDSDTTCFYINVHPHSTTFHDESGTYIAIFGDTSAYPPELYINWEPRGPVLSTPTLSAIPAVSDNPHNFSCGASSDAGGFIAQAGLYYEFQFSSDNGATWSATQTSAAGTPSKPIDLKTLLSLQPLQYCLNANCKIRVRAKGAWESADYYSGWATSNAFSVDYRIAPSAPSSLAVNRDGTIVTIVYEGETNAHIKLTAGRPTTYNTHNRSGAVMGFTYQAQYGDQSTLGSASSDAGVATVDIPFKVAEKTSGKSDLNTSARARVVDAEGQTGAWLSANITIKRFRAPVVMITRIDRSQTTAAVHVRIADTGYGASQDHGQINKIQFNKGWNGAWDGYLDAVHNGLWNGLDYTFDILFLDPEKRYNLKIRAVNNPPVGTALSGMTGAESASTILEYMPALFAFNDSNATGDQATMGCATRALVVGDDYGGVVNKGCVKVQHNLDVGEKIRSGGFVVAPFRWTIAKGSSGSGWWKVLQFTAPNVECGSTIEVCGYSNTSPLSGRGHWKLILSGSSGASSTYTSGKLAYADTGLSPASFSLRYSSGVYTLYFNIPQYTEYNIFCLHCASNNYLATVTPLNEANTPSGTEIPITGNSPGPAGNLAVWDANGNAVNGSLAASAAPKLVNRQNDTTNTTVSNQLIKMGWGFVQGSSYTAISETITFDSSFDDIPIVVANYIGLAATSGGTPTSQSNFASGGSTQIFGYSSVATANQFTIIIANRDATNLSSSYYYGYSWIAIGTKAR